MSVLNVDTPKAKRSQPRRWGCLKFLLIPIVLAAACYGGMWVFARSSGEWLARRALPIPPDSRLMMERYEHGSHTCEHRIYSHEMSPEDLRLWFIDHHITVSPVLGNYTDDSNFYHNGVDRYSSKQDHLALLRYISLIVTSDYPEDYFPQPSLRIYKGKEIFLFYYPDLILPDGMSAFDVGLC